MLRAKAIEDAKARALNEVGENFLPNRFAASYQKNLKEIADSEDFKSWPAADKTIVEKAVHRSPFHNALKGFGDLNLPAGLVSKVSVGIPLGLGRALLRHAVAKMDLSNAKAAEAFVKTGKLSEQAPQAAIIDALMRRIMIGQSGQVGAWVSSDRRADR